MKESIEEDRFFLSRNVEQESLRSGWEHTVNAERSIEDNRCYGFKSHCRKRGAVNMKVVIKQRVDSADFSVVSCKAESYA